MEARSKNNILCYCVLILILIIAHYIIASNPDLPNLSGWKDYFMWPAISTYGSLGFLGVVLLNFTSLKGLWPADVGIKQKVIFPVIIGLLQGAITAVCELLTNFHSLRAASMGVESIHTQILFGTQKRRHRCQAYTVDRSAVMVYRKGEIIK